MEEPRLDFVTCASPAGLHRMAYWEWGAPDNPDVVVCVHGLTRTGRDFDRLARRLAGRYRVACPDVAGRGRSDCLPDPAFYTVPQYVSDMLVLLARLRAARLDWVGTSMGGLIGMLLGGAAAGVAGLRAHAGAGFPGAGALRFERLVLNDVGPRLDPVALARIGQYVGQPEAFDSFDAAVDYVKGVSASFGAHDDEEWRELTRHVFRPEAGRWVKHYDLRLAQPFAAQDAAGLAAGERMLWQCYDALDCPILVLRGAQSDLLTESTAREMLARNPRASLVEFEGVGHAPTLLHPDQIEPVARFLGVED